MYFYAIFLLLIFAKSVFANEQCNIDNIRSFYTFIKEKGPILQEVQKRKLEVASKINLAEQRPNPEIDFDYLKGDQFGLDLNNFSISAKHIIEFGAKREKRIEHAQSYKGLKENEINLNFHQENLNAIISFQRVAQLDIIISTVKEAIDTFDKIINKLSGRKSLNPEETVALLTLKLASSDYKAQLNDFENEKTILEAQLSFLTNCESLIPKYKNLNFKKLENERSEQKNIGLIQLEDLKLDLKQKELDVQKSLGYSNIAVGPSFDFQIQGNDQFLSGGISVSFTLPVFHTNDGGKLEALRAMNTQKISSLNNKNFYRIQKLKLMQKYHRSLDTLRLMPKLDELESKHQKVEKLFSRGVVSIQMAIESHRQQVEFLKSRFETENDVLETFGKISLIDGDTNALEVLF